MTVTASRRLFVFSPDLVARLRAAPRAYGPDAIETAYDAFLVDPGMGPMTYLTADGRVLWCDLEWWGVAEPTVGDACAAVAIGARNTGVSELRGLLPPRPDGAPVCPHCDGTGWAMTWRAGEAVRETHCRPCDGVGWPADRTDTCR